MLAALRLGASRVNGIDLDPNSVRTTANLLNRYARDDEWHVEERSVFALRSQTFPVVYIIAGAFCITRVT
jgi:ribosomal protein L11 methylase PrmA